MTLSAQVLTKRYGDAPGYAAVCGVSLELNRGEFISIVGLVKAPSMAINVDLPEPDRPTIEMNSPRLSSRLTPRTAV